MNVKYEVEADLLQGIADYLAERPFKEVAMFMAALQELKPQNVQAKPIESK